MSEGTIMMDSDSTLRIEINSTIDGSDSKIRMETYCTIRILSLEQQRSPLFF